MNKKFSARIILFYLVLLPLSGCQITWTAAQLASATDLRLCEALAMGRNVNMSRPDITQELEKRAALRPQFKRAALSGNVAIGMTAVEATCAWSGPTDINTTVTEFGTTQQWVYRTYYGPTLGSTTKYLYLKDGIVTAIQN